MHCEWRIQGTMLSGHLDLGVVLKLVQKNLRQSERAHRTAFCQKMAAPKVKFAHELFIFVGVKRTREIRVCP
jgi:hypothetical protein